MTAPAPDSEIVAHVFDERKLAVKNMIATVIRAAKAEGRKIGISGQAPSDYLDFAAFLVEQDIDSVSHNPDAALCDRSNSGERKVLRHAKLKIPYRPC